MAQSEVNPRLQTDFSSPPTAPWAAMVFWFWQTSCPNPEQAFTDWRDPDASLLNQAGDVAGFDQTNDKHTHAYTE